MFKAAFPWAKVAEENAERDYIKELPSTAHDEVAGNVWVNEHHGMSTPPIAGTYGANKRKPSNLPMNTALPLGL